MFVRHRFQLAEETIDLLRVMVPKFGFNGFGEFIFYRTYSREICHKCRSGIKYGLVDLQGHQVDKAQDYCPVHGFDFEYGQETWADVIIRMVNGVFSIRKDWYLRNHIAWDESFWQHYAKHFAISAFLMEWMPPGRGLWAMGTDYVYERGSMALQNCGFKLIGDHIGADINWTMDALMNGVGVGFTPVRDDRLKVFVPRGTYDYVILDSREGWCEATELLINAHIYPGQQKPRLIYDKVRPAGQPIRGFGGISSGPEPLMRLHKQIEEFVDMFGTTNWYDSVLFKADLANAVGCCVISGNVRRSAELCAGAIDDVIDLKNYDKYPYRETHGYMSNNSVLLKESDDFERLGEIAERILTNGEPGIINCRNLPFGRIGKSMDGLRLDKAIGFNPCQTFDSKILTPSGIRKFGHCNEGDLIWSEAGWTKIAKKWSTGVNKIYAYHTTAGVFYGTENHRVVCEGIKVAVKDSPGIDVLRGPYKDSVLHDPKDILDGLIIGDGSDYHGRIILYIGQDDQSYFDSEVGDLIGIQITGKSAHEVNTRIISLPLTYERTIPDQYYYADRNVVCGFLRGLFSANGCVVGNRVQLKAASFKLIEQVQTMLSSVGIKSYYTTNKTTLVAHQTGEYWSKQSYDLAISDDRAKFLTIIGFLQNYKTAALQDLVAKIKSSNKSKETFDIVRVEFLGEEETFDLTVDNMFHTYWTQGCNVSNCGEQNLESAELCTLVESAPTMCVDEHGWYKALEYATLYASTVTLLPTHRPETNAVMQRNRRIGVGIIDVAGWQQQIGTTSLTKHLRYGYGVVRRINQWVNNEAGIPEAIRVTTIKPGGTTPKLPGLRSGWSWPTFGLTLRRVRVARNQAVHAILVAAGIPHEPDVFSANTDVFEWPIDQSDGDRVRSATEVSLWEQAVMLVLMQREWSDNAVSNTLYFKPKWNLIKDLNLGQSFAETDMPAEILIQIYGFLTIAWDDFLEVQEHEVDGLRCVLSQDIYSDDWHLKVYKYDPNHEEDSVEHVLAAIAPLIKSASVLPHCVVGVYRQMPEEGISREEYNRRLSTMLPIDWSKLRRSDGVDEKYCEGPSCEVVR